MSVHGQHGKIHNKQWNKVDERDLMKIRENVMYLPLDSSGEPEPTLPLQKLKYLLNALIDDGLSKYEGQDAVAIMHSLYRQSNVQETLEVCAMCTRKIGTMRCKLCATRYCSRACQVSHWPEHKAECRARDVD